MTRQEQILKHINNLVAFHDAALKEATKVKKLLEKEVVSTTSGEQHIKIDPAAVVVMRRNMKLDGKKEAI